MLERRDFFGLMRRQAGTRCWRLDYYQVRPHSALADRAPEEFVRDWKESSATSLRAAWPAKAAPAGAVHGIAATAPKPLQLFGPPQDRSEGEAEKCPWTSDGRQRKRIIYKRLPIDSVECDKRRKYRDQTGHIKPNHGLRLIEKKGRQGGISAHLGGLI